MNKIWGFVVAGLLASLLLAALVSPYASKAPDGLEKVAKDKGFAQKGERAAAWRFPLMPGYAVPGVGSESLSTALAGLAGTVVVFGVALGVAKVVSRKRAARGGRAEAFCREEAQDAQDTDQHRRSNIELPTSK